jgi:5,10-methylenetetrahydromethanopterin reductase
MARLGIVLHHGIESGAALADHGRLAEDGGFDALWVTERYFHEETFSLLGYLAAVTRQIELGLGVANPYTRHPALLAMASATLDRLSGGRFVLGLGRSEREVVEGRMGIPYGQPRAALAAAVALVRRLTAGERVDGPEGPARLAVLPVRPRLPIYVAAIGPRALALAGAVADGVLLNAYVPAAYVRWAVAEVGRAARAAGRDPAAVDVACMLVVRPTDDPAGLRPALKPRLVRLLAERHVGEVLLERGGFDPAILGPLRASVARDGGTEAVGLVSDRMVDAFHLLGPPAALRDRIAAYREAGVRLPLLLPRLEDYRRVAEALGR